MRLYINPIDKTKEEWLNEFGVEVTAKELTLNDVNMLPVVLIDNGMFTAAGICYSARELKAFTNTADRRPKKYYMVSREKLEEIAPRLKLV